jgi:hypothetical protein
MEQLSERGVSINLADMAQPSHDWHPRTFEAVPTDVPTKRRRMTIIVFIVLSNMVQVRRLPGYSPQFCILMRAR